MFSIFDRHKDNSSLLPLLNQIQELKAVNDYQAYEFEKKITELEKQNAQLKEDCKDQCKDIE